MRIMLECRVCGKPFPCIPALVDRKRYCSRACQRDTWARFRSKLRRVAAPLHRPELGYCEEHTSKPLPDGYVRVSIAGRMTAAHRYALERHIGRPLAPGMCALHKCDNRRCCRETHLFEGTLAENVADCIAKGRRRPATGAAHGSVTKPERLARGARSGKYTKPWATPRGMNHGMSKLTETDASEILRRQACGEMQRELAQEFGVSESCVSAIIHGHTWKHVPR